MTPGYIDPYEAGILIAVAVWGDPKFRSDAMSFMRVAYDTKEMRGDWERDYPHGKGELLLEDVHELIAKLLALRVGHATPKVSQYNWRPVAKWYGAKKIEMDGPPCPEAGPGWDSISTAAKLVKEELDFPAALSTIREHLSKL